jgi:hypothetical protein
MARPAAIPGNSCRDPRWRHERVPDYGKLPLSRTLSRTLPRTCRACHFGCRASCVCRPPIPPCAAAQQGAAQQEGGMVRLCGWYRLG